MKHPEKGALVWVKLEGTRIAGIVLDSGFSSRGDFDECKIELLAVNHMVPGQPLIRQVYPRSVQSYKLTKRNAPLPGEVTQ
jgi:hypothetical protein